MAFFSSIKDIFFKKKVQSNLPKRTLRSRPFENTQTILILFDASQSSTEKQVRDRRDVWVNGGKDVFMVGFDPNQKATADKTAFFHRLTPNEFVWDGSLKKGITPYSAVDLLLVYNPNQIRELHYLASTTKADFKVGTLPEEDVPNDLDLILEMPTTNTVQDFFENLSTYLNKITST